ncbi:hypothetical protein JD844_015258 [Phrynosoma platyrhinos]|uniref:Ankyrin repeat domain-containing protein n=1 Tax=Phrynosoma platyrhinos TaxID=52577 RepID=A0ABQ7T7F8_PHRPL|nr:hypothetical protein JD844_015258 [Phrynosoma platyrhinos]
MEYATTNNPTAITPEEYFDPNFDLKDRDVGRPKEVTIRTQKFKANLWMCESFPLSLVEQVSPIVDLMARTSAHFARLKDFITLDFPPGFPVKIEIPLFHVLNARITFGNVNGCTTAEEASPQSVFEIPQSYRVQDDGRNARVQDEDNEIMQFAIQQSLMETGRSGESLLASSRPVAALPRDPSSFERDLQLAMELSVREQQDAERRRREEEESEIQRALQLSLTEK